MSRYYRSVFLTGCSGSGPSLAARQPQQYQCGVCGRQFSATSSYYHHMAIHRGETTCPLCRKVLSHKGNLKNHMKTVHGVTAVDPARWAAPQPGAAPQFGSLWPVSDVATRPEQRWQQQQQEQQQQQQQPNPPTSQAH